MQFSVICKLILRAPIQRNKNKKSNQIVTDADENMAIADYSLEIVAADDGAKTAKKKTVGQKNINGGK